MFFKPQNVSKCFGVWTGFKSFESDLSSISEHFYLKVLYHSPNQDRIIDCQFIAEKLRTWSNLAKRSPDLSQIAITYLLSYKAGTLREFGA